MSILGLWYFTSHTADVEKYHAMLPSHCGYEDLRNGSNYSYETNTSRTFLLSSRTRMMALLEQHEASFIMGLLMRHGRTG
ncbi:hypothetical protein X797_005828 [Metarhizium robertsii]|uniref:Uncharacterized protein n=1 Tax=Metarhizium robertsii TaxID=568076 RepID=A0A014PB66_9HYPO|nr:hypothetical protein X797_005828 [Metarhizium robertsii]